MAVGVGKGVVVSASVAVAKSVVVLVGGAAVCVELAFDAVGDASQAVKIPATKPMIDQKKFLVFMIYSFLSGITG